MQQAILSRTTLRTVFSKQARASLPAAVAILLFIAPSLAPAALAYPVTDNTFAGGAATANVTFTPGNTTAIGPSLHLLTNATYTGASVDVTGSPVVANYSAFRTSTADWNAGQERTHLTVFGGMGSMALATTGAVKDFNASNGFGNGTFSTTAAVGGRIVLSGALTGTYTTGTIDALGAPWGLVYADGRAIPPSTISFNLLDINNTTVVSGLQSGSRVPLTLEAYPSLKVQVVLATPDPLVTPEVTSFGIGQRAADFSIAGNVSHTAIGTDDLGDRIRTLPAAANLTKEAGNPIITTQPATYYSQYLSMPFVIAMNGNYSMYFAAGTNVGHSGAGIARATSTDLRNWSVDAAALLTPTAASYDAFALTHPYVFADPEGSGYIMLYTAWSTSLACQVARATSPDAITWTKTGVVLGPNASGWDNFAVGQVARVEYAAGTDTYTMFYSGTATTTGGGNALGRATSNDGISWTRDGANPVMNRSVGAPDQDDAQGGKITSWAGTLYYYYTCINAQVTTCLAVSTTGASWGKVGRVINRTAATFDSSYASDADAIVAPNGTLYVFYAGFDGTSSKIGRTTAPFQAGEWNGRFDLLAGPTPDWVTFTKSVSNPVISVAPGTYYSGYLSQPQVLKMGNQWWMYLSAGQNSSYQGASIARATSNDLATWTMDAAPLLGVNNTTYDMGGLIHPYVVENPFNPGYLMYYTGVSGSGTLSIDLATSQDGLNWTKVGAVLNGSGFGYDSAQVSATAYVKYNASADRLRMWYAGYDASGAVATGIVSSPDGVTWTRIVFQPVLPHGGAGSIDQDVAQGGKIVEMRSTLVFYYTCKGSTSKVNTCMAQSLDGGFSFSKRGAVLNASTFAAFDSQYAADPAAVLTDNALLLFYAGYDGSTSQIGVARGVFDPSAPNAWLGAPQQLPRFISGFSANATAGAGTTLSLSVRSSSDGFSWTNYETVSAADNTVNTPIQRYIMYRATFSGGANPSLFKSALFNLTSYFESGRYRSDLIAFPAVIDRVMIDPSSSGSGRLDWYVEDGVLGAVATPPNNWVDVSGGGSGLIVRADFWGASSETPIVQSFTLRVEADGLPADVTIQVGITAAPRLVTLGTLSSKVRVSIPGGDMNAAVAAVLFAVPYATSANILLNLTSSHFGIIRLSNLSLDYTLKNPIVATFLPNTTTPTARENATTVFAVNASTCCGAFLNYSWYRDGVAVSPPTPTSYPWTPTFDDAGPHTVTVQILNGELTVTHVWNVNVLNEDRPPAIDAALPATDPSVSYQASAPFSIETSDPDGDAITFLWTVDGAPWDATSNETTIGGLASGSHDVTVMVLDGVLNASHTWTLTLTDSPPDATYTPDTPLEVSHRASVTLTVAAVDPDGDPVTFKWTVAGTARPEATAFLVVTAPSTGSFTVRVVVTGGKASTTHDWTVTSTDSPPTAVFSPGDAITVSHVTSVEFSAEGTDPDGDPIAYSWSVDGAPVANALSSKFTLSGPAVGAHNVSVILQAGILALTHHWSLTATNAAPTLAGLTPSNGHGLDTRAGQDFSLTAADADGDPLSYGWTLNGATENATGPTYRTPANLPPGTYTLAVTVSDGAGGSTSNSWTFTVPAAAPDTAISGLGLLILLPLLLVAAMVAVFVMRRRKGKAPESAPEKAPEKAQQNVSDSSSLFQPTAPAQDAPVYAPEPPAEAPPQSEYDSLYGPPPESP